MANVPKGGNDSRNVLNGSQVLNGSEKAEKNG